MSHRAAARCAIALAAVALTACGTRVPAEPVVALDGCATGGKPAVVCTSRPLASQAQPAPQRLRSGDLVAPAVAAPAVAAGDDALVLSALARDAVERVNTERANAGIAALRPHEGLTTVAGRHAAEQAAANRASHEGATGDTVAERLDAAGVRWNTLGENVAAGYRDPAELIAGWMGSPAQRRNLLNADFTDIGIGVAASADGTYYWTMDLAC